jgi:hypothetical protein
MDPHNTYSCFVCGKYYNGISERTYWGKDCAHGDDIEIDEQTYLDHITG